MFQKFRKYFPGGVLLFMAPLLLRGVPITAPVSKYYPVRFEDAKVSSRARTIVLVNILRNDIHHCLPAQRKGAVPYKITVHYEKGDPREKFSIKKIRNRVCRITLPEDFEDLLALPDALSTLTAWFLAAAAGYDPISADRIINTWYVTGIARRLLRNVAQVKSPFLHYFPSAYVLISRGFCPPLDSLLEQELTGEDSCARLLYEEYSELLVLICSRQGLFQKGLICTLLEKTFQSSGRKDLSSHFQDFVFTHADKKKKRLFKTTEGTEKDSRSLLNSWFRQEVEKILNGIFQPSSAEKIESLYLQAARFEAPAKKDPEKERPGKKIVLPGKKGAHKQGSPVKMIRGTLAELPELYKSIADPGQTALKMALAMGSAVRVASPDLLSSLLEVRRALLAFSAEQNSGTARRLLAADRSFYLALEQHALLEQFLSETERKVLPPGTRYHVTLTVLNQDPVQDLPTIRKLEAFLRRTQGKVPLP